jgi:hypothetical protein
MVRDPDLKSLAPDPAFQEILDAVKSAGRAPGRRRS